MVLGHGDGTFGAPVIYATGNGSESVTVADVNDDGKPRPHSYKRTWRNNDISPSWEWGRNLYENQLTYNAGGAVDAYPNGIVVGDFNRNGIPDIAATLVNTQIAILIGNGLGGFQAPVLYPAGNMPFGIAAADVNGDGKLDIIAADEGGGAVAVLLGNGDGSFRAPVTYPVGFDPQNVALADFNGDGKIDIAVENQNSGTVSILLGNGDGTFQPQVAYSAGAGAWPTSIAVGDFNGDGKVDIAVSNSGGSSVRVLVGNGNGSFQSPISYNSGASADDLIVGNFNGNGIPDIAVAEYSPNVLAILLGEQVASYSQGSISVPGSGTHNVLASYPGDQTRTGNQSATVPLTATGLLTQAISFSPLSSPVTYGAGPFLLSATGGGSGNPVTFSVLSGPGHVVGNWLYVDGVGTIVVGESSGQRQLYGGSQVTQSVVVDPASPSVSVSCSPNPITYGSQNTTCTATIGGGATGTVSFFWNGGNLLGHCPCCWGIGIGFRICRNAGWDLFHNGLLQRRPQQQRREAPAPR